VVASSGLPSPEGMEPIEMVKKIKDLVSVNTQAALVKGVQLSWYGDPQQEKENERLATGYIFSSGHVKKPHASAINIFESVRDSLSKPGSQNVFTIIADYGHGKSHFALVMANYFGRDHNAPLVEKIIKQIESCSDPNTAAHFRSFKKNAGKPQLVVRLSGHDFTDLRQGLLRALRRALDEHEATHDYAIKAVSAEAAKWLRSLNKEQLKIAEEYLDKHHRIDVEALIDALERFDTSKEILAKELSRVVHGWEVNFGADLNLKSTINEVIRDLCTGAEAPFYKMVILFDELGIYAEKWCYNRMEAGGLAPQQITEACDDNRGRLCLVGFVQRHIEDFVKGSALEEDFMKWAGRFPRETTFTLEANLEQVIKGLIRKNPAGWDHFARDNMPQITQESDRAWEVLKNYQNNTRWTKDKFINVVGVGSYPLHPLTTGLLCNLTFTQGARTIIDVVHTVVGDFQDEPALVGGKLRLVRPTILVDLFEGNFEGKEERYSLYVNALRHLGNNAPQALYEVLKALFLYDVGNLKKYESQAHANVLARLCGLTESEVTNALDQLDKDFSVVRFSQATKEYQFSGIGTSRNEIRQQVIRETANRKLPSLSANLNSLGLLERMPLPDSEAVEFKAEFGLEGDEWNLAPRLLDASRINAEQVRSLANDLKSTNQARGLIIYLVSEDGVELDEARSQAITILDQIHNSANSSPIAVGVPQAPAANIGQEVLIRQVLDGWGPAKREQYGEAYGDVVKDSDRRLEDALRAHLRHENMSYLVASAVKQRLKVRDEHRVDRIADKLFEDAFPYRAPAKFHVMNVSKNAGNTAVAEVSRQLLINDVAFGTLSQMTQGVVKSVLLEGPDRWGALNSKYRIQEPTNDRVLKAWKELDNSVGVDRPSTFASLIDKLRGSPYGYDEYTLTLLLSAWIGRNKNELTFAGSLDVKRPKFQQLSLSDLQGQLKKARDFTKWLLEGKVQLQNVRKGKKDAAVKHLKQLEEESNYDLAVSLLASTKEVIAGISADDELIPKINEAATKLKEQVDKVSDYYQLVLLAHKASQNTNDVLLLLRLAEKFPPKPDTRLDYDDAPFVDAKKALEGKIASEVDNQTRRPLERIEGYEKLRDEFAARRDALHNVGRADLERRYVEALQRIEEEHRNLKAQQEEGHIIAEVNAMKVSGSSLSMRREYVSRLTHLLENDLATASQETRMQVESKLRYVQEGIDEQVAWLAGLPHKMEEITDTGGARPLLYEIIRREREYEGTAESSDLQRYKQSVEIRARDLEAEESLRAIRDTKAQARLATFREKAQRVAKARTFDESLRELIDMEQFRCAPSDVTFNAAEEQEIEALTSDSRARVDKLYSALITAPVPQDEVGFGQRQLQLHRAIEAFSLSEQFPEEWLPQLEAQVEKVKQDLDTWRAARAEEVERQRRDEQEKLRRARNQRLADERVKQAERAHTLREIEGALTTISDALSEVEPPADDEVARLNSAREGLVERRNRLRGWVEESLPAHLNTAWDEPAIKRVRSEVVSHEALCAGDEALSSLLADALSEIERRAELVRQLIGIEKQATSVATAEEAISKIQELRAEFPNSDAAIAVVDQRIAAKLLALREEERGKVRAWLSQIERAIKDNMPFMEANKLLHKLDMPPANLSTEEMKTISSLKEKLNVLRDQDVVNRIADDFGKLATSEQRFECLLRIAEICKLEGMSVEQIDRIIHLFEQRATA
jgi:hypothetical protein